MKSAEYKNTIKNWKNDICKLKSNSVFVASLVGAYVILVPSFSSTSDIGLFNEKRAFQIVVLIATGVSFLVGHSGRQKWLSVFLSLPSLARWGLGVVLGGGLLSSTFAPAPFYSFLEVGHFTLLFVAAGCVAAAIRRVPKLQQAFLAVISVSVVIYIIYFAVGYGTYLRIPDVRLWPNGVTNFDNIRFFNHYQTWTLPLLAGATLAVPQRRSVLKMGLFLVISLWWTLVFASAVRGTVVGMGIAAAGTAVLFRRRAGNWLLVQGSAMVGGVIFYYLLFSHGGDTGKPPALDEFGDSSEYASRLQYWESCLEMIGNNPWFGIGPMHYAWPPYQFSGPASPHSVLMRWFTEWGIPSAIVTFGISIWGIWEYMFEEAKKLRQEKLSDKVGISITASLLAGASHAMVSGVTLAPLSQMFLVLVAGWAWGRYEPSKQNGKTGSSSAAHAVLCALLLVSVVMIGSSVKDLFTTEERSAAYVEATDSNRLSPRYWRQGFLHVRDPEVIERAR
jgi:hypothetical protein